MPKELWTEVDNILLEAVTKATPKKKKCRKAKWLSEEGIKYLRTEVKERQRRKGKIYPMECRIPENSKER